MQNNCSPNVLELNVKQFFRFFALGPDHVSMLARHSVFCQETFGYIPSVSERDDLFAGFGYKSGRIVPVSPRLTFRSEADRIVFQLRFSEELANCTGGMWGNGG